MKICTKCKKEKPIEEFYADKRRASGLQSTCKSCTLSRNRTWLKNHPKEAAEINAAGQRRRWYGLTTAQFSAMLLAQDNKCACCGDPFKSDKGRSEGPQVDHNHTTGKNRALLCSPCNRTIGHSKESIIRCFLAASYLQKHS